MIGGRHVPMGQRIRLVWDLATDRRLPWRARAPAMLALAYVASPFDLIPDSLPGFGWLDDPLRERTRHVRSSAD